MSILNASIPKTSAFVLFLLLFVVLISSIASAQGTYARKITAEGREPLGIISTSEGGNVLLLGQHSVLLTNINASGKKVWQRELHLEGSTYFHGRGIAELSDGRYIVTGSKSFAIDVPFLVEAWLVKLTSAGRVDWQRRFVENRFSIALSSVVSSAEGGFFAAGQRGPDFVFSGNGGVIVASFDSTGDMRWGKVFSDDFRYNVYSFPQMFVTSDQELIVLSQLLSSATGEDLGTLVLKVDADGNLLWKKLLTKKDLKFTSGAVTADGGCILLFSSNRVIRLSSNGDVLWKKRFRVDSKSSESFSVVQNADGGFTIAGVVFSNSGEIFLAKLNSAGKVFRVFSGASAVSYGKLFLSASDSGYAMLGGSVFGSPEDAFLLKLDSNANLPGCNLFRTAKIEKQKFDALETSSPSITVSDWTPREGTHDISSEKVNVTSSPFCP